MSRLTLYTQEMKSEDGFFDNLGRYGLRVLERSRLPLYWRWIAIGLICIAMATSWSARDISVAGEIRVDEIAVKAASVGDYEAARKLLNQYADEPAARQGGSLNHLEELVYPERKVERKIAELEARLVEYPGNRQIYLLLADSYDQIDHSEKSSEYLEKARVLDPNDPRFQ